MWLFTALALGPGVPSHSVQIVISKLQGEFILKSGLKTIRVPIPSNSKPTQETPTTVERYVFRKNANYAVWDVRGLTIRKGNRTFTTRLVELAVSPKLFDSREIEANRALMACALRSPFPSSIAGTKRVGSETYFLFRWEDGVGNPWLEAFVKISLDDPSLRPSLIGRFQGYTLPDGSEGLLAMHDRLAAITRLENGAWGRSTFDPASSEFNFSPLGDGLFKYVPIGPLGCSLEKTSYGTTVLSRVDIRQPTKDRLMESRGTLQLFSGNSPWLAISHEEDGAWLYNLETGSQLKLQPGAAMSMTPVGLLTWNPRPGPTSATLYDVGRFDVRGQWTPEIERAQEAAQNQAPFRKKHHRERERKKFKASNRVRHHR